MVVELKRVDSLKSLNLGSITEAPLPLTYALIDVPEYRSLYRAGSNKCHYPLVEI